MFAAPAPAPAAATAEYPSGTGCVCTVFASYMRALTGTNTFPAIGGAVHKAGCSRREPFMTPKKDVVLTYSTWDEFEKDCAQSRMLAGVHFQPAIDESRRMCAPIADQCVKKAYKLMYGVELKSAPARAAAAAVSKPGSVGAASGSAAYNLGLRLGSQGAPPTTHP